MCSHIYYHLLTASLMGNISTWVVYNQYIVSTHICSNRFYSHLAVICHKIPYYLIFKPCLHCMLDLIDQSLIIQPLGLNFIFLFPPARRCRPVAKSHISPSHFLQGTSIGLVRANHALIGRHKLDAVHMHSATGCGASCGTLHVL